MHDPSITNSAYQSLTDQQLAEIDELCERFERELAEERGPRIETFLADAPDAARDGLLAELLAIEFEYRARQGCQPEPDEYRRRFPLQEGVIASALTSASFGAFSIPSQSVLRLLALRNAVSAFSSAFSLFTFAVFLALLPAALALLTFVGAFSGRSSGGQA